VTAAAITPDGRQLVLGSQAGIEVRSWPELNPSSRIPTDLDNIHDVAFSPDGKRVLVAGGSPAEIGIVDLLNWPSGERLYRVGSHTDVVYRVAWSPDGKQWATASADGRCQTFVATSGERITEYQGHSRPVLSIAYQPDGKSVVSAGIDQTIRMWDPATGRHLRTLDNHVNAVNAVAIRPVTGESTVPVIASISEDRTVRLWQPSIGRLMRFARLPSIPRSLAWSSDGQRLYVGCNDGKIRLVDADTMEIQSINGASVGRIYELVVDARSQSVLVAGEEWATRINLSSEK
jgi:WD40 repeat protein